MITLIFGAGASFGSGSANPPPLGAKLFEHLVELDGYFARLPSKNREIFIRQGFEAGMASIANDADEINPLQKELACYLSLFNSSQDSAYTRLFKRIKKYKNSIKIATLNYDLLIEQSLLMSQLSFSYNPGEGDITLDKIHGSCNFLPDPGNITMNNCRIAGFGSIAEGLKLSATLSHDEILDWCVKPRNNWLSPVLAMYQRDKRVVVNKNLINSIQARYRENIEKSSHIAIVGTKYIDHDEHIWKPISESHAELLIIDPFPKDTMEWAQRSRNAKSYALTKSFDQSVWDLYKFVRNASTK